MFGLGLWDVVDQLKKPLIIEPVDPSLVLQYDQLVADKFTYFVGIKDLTLPPPDIRRSLNTWGGDIVFELTSDRLVKNLYLSLDDGDGTLQVLGQH